MFFIVEIALVFCLRDETGIYRNKDNLRPVEYYNRLPRGRPADVAFVVDPMIATCTSPPDPVSLR